MRTETSQGRAPEEIAFEARRRPLATTGEAGLNNIARGSIPRGRARKLDARQETGASGVSRLQYRSYHRLAGSKTHGVTYRAKGHEKSAEGKLTRQPEAAGTRIDDGETAESTEFEEDVGAARAGSRIIAHGGQSRGMPAGNTRRFGRYDKSDGISRPDDNIGMFKAFGLAEKERRRKGRIERRYARRGYTRIQ